MTRRFTATLAMMFLVVLIGFDLATAPLNPYHTPAAFALGSGGMAAGGFCGALPK
jgi:hypothetical protein